MPISRSNLPVFVSGASAAASAVLLCGVLAMRPGSPAQDTAAASEENGGTGAGTPAAGSATPRDGSATEGILKASNTLVQRGELDRAEAVLRAAVVEQPDDQELRLALAGACVLRQKLDEAYAQYEAALAIGPRPPEIEFTAGTVASQLRRLERAEEHFSAAQAGDPSDPRFPLYLAQVQIAQGRPDEAQRNLLLTTRLDETIAVAWGSLAQLALQENEPNVALQLVERARALEPSVVVWRLIEARACNRAGKAERALVALDGVPDAERQKNEVLAVLGASYGLLGRPQDAAAEFEAAAAARPDDPRLLLDTAVWCERAGELDKARAYAERAAALGSEGGAKMAERLAAGNDGE